MYQYSREALKKVDEATSKKNINEMLHEELIELVGKYEDLRYKLVENIETLEQEKMQELEMLTYTQDRYIDLLEELRNVEREVG